MTVVETADGRLRGAEIADGVLAWRGIPYAWPPVEELRLRPPEPPAPWYGLRDALAGLAVPLRRPVHRSRRRPGVRPVCRPAARRARRRRSGHLAGRRWPGGEHARRLGRVRRDAAPVTGRRQLARGATRTAATGIATCTAVPGVLSLIHISEPTRLGMISYAVFCLKKKKDK